MKSISYQITLQDADKLAKKWDISVDKFHDRLNAAVHELGSKDKSRPWSESFKQLKKLKKSAEKLRIQLHELNPIARDLIINADGEGEGPEELLSALRGEQTDQNLLERIYMDAEALASIVNSLQAPSGPRGKDRHINRAIRLLARIWEESGRMPDVGWDEMKGQVGPFSLFVHDVFSRSGFNTLSKKAIRARIRRLNPPLHKAQKA